MNKEEILNEINKTKEHLANTVGIDGIINEATSN